MKQNLSSDKATVATWVIVIALALTTLAAFAPYIIKACSKLVNLI